jgi:hypothetical protein
MAGEASAAGLFRVGGGLLLLVAGGLLSGCAAVVPLGSLISTPTGGSPPLQIHDETSVRLAEGNFVLVRTNAYGQCKGFSLLGIITIVPATLSKAVDRMYASAQMTPGRPQSVAHLIIQQSTTYWILFGIPKVEVHADVVEFRPEPADHPRPRPPPRW